MKRPVIATGEDVSWISKTPGRCGGDACIRDHRIPVWLLVNYRRLAGSGASDAEILREYPGLSAADLETAWQYHAENEEEIEQAIRENEEGEDVALANMSPGRALMRVNRPSENTPH